MCLLVGVDLIPYFGSSTTDNFGENLKSMFTCNFTGECGSTYKYYILFNVGYVAVYIGSCYINSTSAPFGIVTSALTTPIVVLFWIIFPHVDPSPNTTGIEYAIPSLVLAICGVLVWKKWEINESNRKSYYSVDYIAI